MKKIYLLALGIIALPAFADNNKGFYVAVGGSSIKDYQDGVDNVSSVKAYEISGGYKYNNFLGAELRIGGGLQNGEGNYYFDVNKIGHKGNLERSIDNYQSFYYRAELVNDEAKLYALLGYTNVSSSVKISNSAGAEVLNADNSASGASYGVGVSFVMDEHFNFNIEYRNICDEISGKPNMLTLAVDYRF